MKLLAVYTTNEGQTEKITNFIVQHLQKKLPLLQVELLQLTKDNRKNVINISEYNIIIVGTSVRYGHYSPYIKDFISQHSTELSLKIAAFFGVNLIARKPEKNTVQTNSYTRKFLHWSPWKPTLSAVFAGALRYPCYNWFDRTMIRFIMKLTKGEMNTNIDVEYTDWEQVKIFTETIFLQVDK